MSTTMKPGQLFRIDLNPHCKSQLNQTQQLFVDVHCLLDADVAI